MLDNKGLSSGCWGTQKPHNPFPPVPGSERTSASVPLGGAVLPGDTEPGLTGFHGRAAGVIHHSGADRSCADCHSAAPPPPPPCLHPCCSRSHAGAPFLTTQLSWLYPWAVGSSGAGAKPLSPPNPTPSQHMTSPSLVSDEFIGEIQERASQGSGHGLDLLLLPHGTQPWAWKSGWRAQMGTLDLTLTLTSLSLFSQRLPVVRLLQLFDDALVGIIQGLWVESNCDLS